MKDPYDEGLAAHIGPESCVYARKGIDDKYKDIENWDTNVDNTIPDFER